MLTALNANALLPQPSNPENENFTELLAGTERIWNWCRNCRSHDRSAGKTRKNRGCTRPRFGSPRSEQPSE